MKLLISTLLLWFVMISSIAARKETKALSRLQCERSETEIVTEWMKQQRLRLSYITAIQAIKTDSLTMPIHWRTFGSKPTDGRSLYISLHGGGNVPAEFNDGQWRNQWKLYTPVEGVYLCPRAAYNDWDMHCKPLTDGLYRDIILYCMTHMDVNPDKVYLMGYSAGGDGVWRLAPRMADVWAAASMMAGHPGDVRLENLRNLPFTIWCGEKDGAYDRNKLDAARILQMDSLQQNDPEGYIHYGEIIKDKPHWMDRADTVAVEWMAQYIRNPYPEKIVWRQEEVLKDGFYWLSIPIEEARRGAELRAYREKNTIHITQCDYSQVTIHLNDKMMNLDQPITVFYKDKKLYERKVKRIKENIKRNLLKRQDPRYAFPCDITLKISK